MYSVDPGEGWGPARIYGAQQTDRYEPLYSRLQGEHSITRWKFSDAERKAIADGKDLYLSIMTFGNPLQPVSLWVEDTDNANV